MSPLARLAVGAVAALACCSCQSGPDVAPMPDPDALDAALADLDARVGDPERTPAAVRDEALGFLDGVLTHEPAAWRALVRRARWRVAWGRERGALEDVDALEALYGETAETEVVRGLALHGLGERSEALAAYRSALAHDPRHVEALVQLGVLLVEAGRLDESTAYFERALAIEPDQSTARSYLELARSGGGAGEGASATDGGPDGREPIGGTASGTANGGATMGTTHRATDGTTNDRAANGSGRDPYDTKRFGLALIEAGEDARGYALLTDALRALPADGELLAGAGEAAARLGRHRDAAALLDAAARARPEDARVWRGLGRELLVLAKDEPGRAHAAARALAEADRLEPDAGVLVDRGRALERVGDLAGATSAYRAAIADDDGCVEAHAALAGLLAREVGPNAGIAALERGLAARPDAPLLLANLAVLAATRGDADACTDARERLAASAGADRDTVLELLERVDGDRAVREVLGP